jgi:predicted RNase H-like nuclease
MYKNLGIMGISIAKDDKVIEETLENVLLKEKQLLANYQHLKDFRKNAPEEFARSLDIEIEKKELLLKYKMQSKDEQCKSLSKLLEYINTIEKKNKQLECQKIANKLDSLEQELEIYRRILPINFN